MPTTIGRCEWCRDDVYDNRPHYVNGMYLWHDDCHDDAQRQPMYVERVESDSGRGSDDA